MAAIILVIITSMGIYGFLSAAYQETYANLLINDNKIEFLDNKAKFYEDDIQRYDKELTQISSNISILSNAKAQSIQVRDTTVSGGVRSTISTAELRLSQKRIEVEEENRKAVQEKRQVAADSLQKFRLEILNLDNNSEVAGELGPLKYLAGLTDTPMDVIINILLLTIIFVFDPLAVLLLIAANISLRSRSVAKEETKAKVQRDFQKEAVNAKARAKRVRDREKIYKDFFAKLGKRELTNRDYEQFFNKMGSEELKGLGLDPDEIRLKLDQIMEWNELPTQKSAPNKRYLEVAKDK